MADTAKIETTAADREDAESVLYWLLTDYPDALHAVALAAAHGDAIRSAVVANAARGWREACASLAAACDDELQAIKGDRDDLRARLKATSDACNEARNAIDRVRQLHAEIPYKPGQCFCANPYPCPTIRALDGVDLLETNHG
ncbi:hypothetical protein [Nonomuraea rubra]|uniref:Uncharacterized protein n=1 Tax=Nonomuraea rubra TaxID=46180 RepID=A0A7X0P6K3_9ACTN|nr:hypothetical protein [Nonomuraea rubra]MBB6556212.1 hypothetical protein [Nonomuraea rubra]